MYRILQAVCLFVAFSHPTFAQVSDEDFTLVRKSERIVVYERWLTFHDANPPYKAREVKGDFEIKATIEEAIALLKSEKRIRDWQTHVSEFAVYPSDDTSTWHEYSYHDIPWPVSDQDHFLEYQVQPGSTPDNVFITFQSKVHPKFPAKEDVTRMTLSGSWRFTRLEANRIKASYRIISKPIGIPRIFTDPVIRNNIMTTIESYVEILEGKK
jgi:hypothetical protein